MGIEQQVVKDITDGQRCLVKAKLTTPQWSEHRLGLSYHENCTMTTLCKIINDT